MCVKPNCLYGDIKPPMILSNNVINYVESQKYLGVTICSNRHDDVDILQQCRSLYGRGNTIIKSFRNCTDEVKCQLFKSFCSNIYCSPLWNLFKKESMRRLKVAYNRIFRILLELEPRLSMSSAFVQRSMDSFTVLLRKAIVGFKQRLSETCNSLVKTILNSLYFISCTLSKSWDKNIYKLKI